MKNSKLILAGLAVGGVFGQAHAGLTVTQSGVTVPTSWATNPLPNDGSTLAMSTVSDPSSATVNQTLSGNGVLSQTFTAASALTIDTIAINGVGASGLALSLHLFQFSPTGGYTGASGGYNPNTAYTSGVDLLGGGSGLSFTYNGATGNNLIYFQFSGADQVTLNSGSIYAFEVWSAPANTGSFFWARTGTDPYAGGSMYQASGAGSQSGTSTVIRGNVSGAGNRDAAFAIYAAPVPEPASVAVLGFGAFALLRKPRK